MWSDMRQRHCTTFTDVTQHHVSEVQIPAPRPDWDSTRLGVGSRSRPARAVPCLSHVRDTLSVSWMDLFEEAGAALSALVGQPARFRDDQWEAIEALVERRGGGCSSCSARGGARARSTSSRPGCCATRGAGPTLLVSPLLALMRNQIAHGRARRRADAARSTATTGTSGSAIEDDARADERRPAAGLAGAVRQRARSATTCSPSSSRTVGPARGRRGALHQRLGPRLPARLPAHRAASSICCRAGVPVLCTTATANDRVVADIVEQLGDDLASCCAARSIARASPSTCCRPSRRRPSGSRGSRDGIPELARHRASSTASPSPTRAASPTGCDLQGIEARAYTGADDTDAAHRASRTQLLANEIKVRRRDLGAGHGLTTSPTSRSSSTSRCPGSPIAYYQQVGRAGRALDHAYAIAARAATKTREIQDYFIDTAFPPQRARRGDRRAARGRDDWVEAGAHRGGREPAADPAARRC